MDEEIKRIIEQNLPQQVGDVLKRRLQKADADAAELVKVRAQCDDYQKQRDAAYQQVKGHLSLDDRTTVLDKREKEVAEKELAIKLHELRVQLTNEKCEAIYRLAETVFRFGPTKLFTSESRRFPVNVGSGGYMQEQSESRSGSQELG